MNVHILKKKTHAVILTAVARGNTHVRTRKTEAPERHASGETPVEAPSDADENSVVGHGVDAGPGLSEFA